MRRDLRDITIPSAAELSLGEEKTASFSIITEISVKYACRRKPLTEGISALLSAAKELSLLKESVMTQG